MGFGSRAHTVIDVAKENEAQKPAIQWHKEDGSQRADRNVSVAKVRIGHIVKMKPRVEGVYAKSRKDVRIGQRLVLIRNLTRTDSVDPDWTPVHTT